MDSILRIHMALGIKFSSQHLSPCFPLSFYVFLVTCVSVLVTLGLCCILPSEMRPGMSGTSLLYPGLHFVVLLSRLSADGL